MMQQEPKPGIDFSDLISDSSTETEIKTGIEAAGAAHRMQQQQPQQPQTPPPLDFSDLIPPKEEGPLFDIFGTGPVMTKEEYRDKVFRYSKAAAQGLLVDLPKAIYGFVTGPATAPLSVEELENPVTREQLKQPEQGGMTEAEIEAERHKAIVRRATGREVDIGEQAKYLIPIYGQAKFGADVVEAYRNAKTNEDRIRILTSTIGALAIGKALQIRGTRSAIETLTGVAVDPAKIMEGSETPLTNHVERASEFKEWKEAAPLQVNDEPPAPPPAVDNLQADAANTLNKVENLAKTDNNPIVANKLYEAQHSGGTPIGDMDVTYQQFQRFRDIIRDYPETMLELPDVKDIENNYPAEFNAALQFKDPQVAMGVFADRMSDRIESREISQGEAESIGGRMEQYLAARMRNDLTTSFDAQVRRFAQEKGIIGGFNKLWTELATRLGSELRGQSIDAEEQNVLNQISERLQELTPEEIAGTAGADVTLTPSGDKVVTDMETGERIARVKSDQELDELNKKIGDPKGSSLDGGGRTNDVPPSGIAKGPPSTEGPMRPDDELMEPYESPTNFLQKIHNSIRLHMARWFTIRHGVFAAWDQQSGTSFLKDVFGPTQETKRIGLNNTINAVNRLSKEVAPLLEGLTLQERRNVGRALETMTPGEIVEQGFQRRMTPEEINAATLLASQEIDLPKVFDYRRSARNLMQSFKGNKLIEKMKDLDGIYNLDDNHKSAVRLMDYATTQSRKDFDLGAIVRLADAIMSDSPSRADFMKANNFVPNMYRAVEALDKFFEDMGPEFGVQLRQMIRGYMPHYRVFDGGMGRSKGYLFQKGLEDTPEGKFISQMARTGELDVFEQDPLVSAVRYARAGYMSRDFYPVLKGARQAAALELSKLPPGQQRYAKGYIDSYFTDIQGRPDDSVEFVQSVTDKTFEQLGMDPGINVRRGLIDTIASLVYSSQVGLRPSIALRHLNQMVALGYIPFGKGRVMDALRYIADPDLIENIRQARDKGILAQLGPSWLESPGERGVAQKLIGGLSGAAQRTAEWGMTANGLKSVYELTQYIWYNEARARAVNKLNSFYNGDLTRAEVYKDLHINWYDTGFIKQFDDIVRQIPKQPELIDRAAHVLGMETGRDMSFMYGNANHAPFLSTNAGRLIGIFGVWSTFMADYMGRVVSRGTPSEIAARVARTAAVNGAIWSAGKLFGLQMKGWYFLPHLAYLNMTNTGGYPFLHPTNYIPFQGVARDVNDALNDPDNQDSFHFFMRLAGLRPSTDRDGLW